MFRCCCASGWLLAARHVAVGEISHQFSCSFSTSFFLLRLIFQFSSRYLCWWANDHETWWWIIKSACIFWKRKGTYTRIEGSIVYYFYPLGKMIVYFFELYGPAVFEVILIIKWSALNIKLVCILWHLFVIVALFLERDQVTFAGIHNHVGLYMQLLNCWAGCNCNKSSIIGACCTVYMNHL